jgi:fermentation-respiration switch protein FrsA (DUF1100 family)
MARIAGLFIGILFVSLAMVWWVGGALSAPANRPIMAPPADLSVKPVEFGGVKGWFVSAGSNLSCVALMHGVHSDRTAMIGRALFLKKAGYSSLLFDFQAHGETPGKNITFGFREAANARAAVEYLKRVAGCPKIAVIGQSLGGAASLLGEAPVAADALILESVYPTIEDAVADRLAIRLGTVGRWMTPLLTVQIPLRLDVSLANLRPIEAIRHVKAPLLIVAGDQDEHTLVEETRKLFESAPKPKDLWIIEGAKHVDLYQYSGREYENRVLAFLSRYIGDERQGHDMP